MDVENVLMEAVLKQARVTRHPRLVADDANMHQEVCKTSLWYKSRHMFIEAPGEDSSTCRSKGPNGELIARTYDDLITTHGLQGKSKKDESGGRFRVKGAQSSSFSGGKRQGSSGLV